MRKSCAWPVPGPASPRARVRSWTIEKRVQIRFGRSHAAGRLGSNLNRVSCGFEFLDYRESDRLDRLGDGLVHRSVNVRRPCHLAFYEATHSPPAETRSKLLLAVNVRQCLLVRLVRHIVGGQEYKCEPYVGMLLKLLNQRTTLVRLSV